MTCSHCVGSQRIFDSGRAQKDLARHRRKGPSAQTLLLVDMIAEAGVPGRTVLDIGGGVGAVQHALLERGAASAVNVDASPAYQEASRQDARARQLTDRVAYKTGDFVAAASTVSAADLVTLDRVICCYPDMPALVDRSAERARVAYGFVAPRDAWPVRAGFRALNFLLGLTGNPFRAFVHPMAEIDRRVRAHGFAAAQVARKGIWEVRVYRRAAPAGNLPLA